MDRLLNLFKGLGSIATIIALIGAVPYFGLRYTMGRIDFIVDVFNDEIASESSQVEAALTGLLVTILWIGWAMIVMSLLTEIANQLRGKPVPSLPVFPGIQTMSRNLVTASTLIFATFTVMSPALAATSIPTPAPATADLAPDMTSLFGSEQSSQTIAPVDAASEVDQSHDTYDVARGDTWWSLAETHLGDGLRWQEIRDANAGRVMADGTAITDSTEFLGSGWDLVIPGVSGVETSALASAVEPAAATDAGGAQWVVDDGEHFWMKAEQALVNGWGRQPTEDEIRSHWIDVQAANASLISSGDADLIFPGEELVMPPVPDDPLVDTVVLEAAAETEADVSYEDQIGATGSESAEAVAPANSMPEPVVVPGVRSLVEVEVEPELEIAVGDVGIDDLDGIGLNQTTAVVGFGAGGVLFATFMAMRLKKRNRWTRSVQEPGETPATPDADSAELEREVMAASDFELADFYGRAWRSLASRPMEADDECQPLLAIRHHDELQVLMSEPRQDAPFPWTCATVEEDRAVWSIPIDEAMLEQLPDDLVNGALPLMVTVGENVFVNLEAVGPLGVAGDPARTGGLTRALVWELAISPWIDGIDIRITEAAAKKLRLDAGESAVTINQEVTANTVLAIATLDSHSVSNIHSARAILGAEHYPSLVIGDASDADGLHGVLQASREQRAPVGIIMLDDRSSTYVADVDESGNMVLSPSGLRVRASFAEVDRGEMFVRLEEQRSRLVSHSDSGAVIREVPPVFFDDFARVAPTDGSVGAQGHLTVPPEPAVSSSDSAVVVGDGIVDGVAEAEAPLEPMHFDGVYEPVVSPSVELVGEFPHPPILVGMETPDVSSYDGVPLVTEGDSDAFVQQHVPTAEQYEIYEVEAAPVVCEPSPTSDQAVVLDDAVVSGDPVIDIRDDVNLLTVEILGTPTIVGEVRESLSEAVVSLVTFLAVEGDQSRQGVEAAMWGAGTEVKKETFRSFIKRARARVYTENFPLANDSRYRVVNVVTDFEMLMEQMRQAERIDDDHARLAAMLEALTLIKGMPFGSDDLSAKWNWIDSLSTQPRIVIETAVSEAVQKTFVVAIELERYDDALIAIQSGLRANPYSEWLVLTQVEILANSDHRKAAKDCVEEYERKCEEEFGGEPSPKPRKLLSSYKAAS